MEQTDPACLAPAEVSGGFPEGWVYARLADGLVQSIQPGFACGANTREGDGVPHLRPMNVTTHGRISLSDLKLVPPEFVDREERILKRGDVLFNNTNSPELVGKTALYDLEEPRAFSNHMTRVRCNTARLDPAYCALALHQLWREGYFLAICNKHVSQASVGRQVLLDTRIPLPPLDMQRRIVAKVETLLARVNAARDRLARVPAILKPFRQSVLAAACSGRLTEDWQERSTSPAEVPCTGSTDLPVSWRVVPLSETCSLIVDCPHSTPKWSDSGEICLRTTNFKPGLLDLREVRFVAAEAYVERTRRAEPRKGDVLYSREGGILGIACQVPPGLKACLGQRMMLMRPQEFVCNGTYLMHVLNSPGTVATVSDLTGGSASPHLNVQEIKQFAVPLPPLAEQNQIVRRVESLFALADTIDQRAATALRRADRLTQSILARALRGGLVPAAQL